ncbi:NAD-dependent epimerase/dehydratase family protein [Sphaerochaeta pleomorpha]|uniref:NAD-dependent epimerase/dehydratase family protein n=1 Tax=Sphaerochaeta pleomorpha TaxID=1131707 RepID=UPI0002DCF6E6|nr:NAD(P)-dependent oxidoreductase [Sphaerochaeta pleomorpha]
MQKQRIFLTGATGNMGFCCLQELLKDGNRQDIVLLVLDTPTDRKKLKPFESHPALTIHWGDLTHYDDVYECMEGVDIVLHTAALVSPAADYHPDLSMKINYGSMKNILRSIKAQRREDTVKVVSIGTIAEMGDRMPPIHWGRIGDPVKPSIFDYYAVSKVAAERALVESGLKYWVSLRQTGILGKAMGRIQDAIIFHNCLDNVLEYISDRDSGILLKNLCKAEQEESLPLKFWGHIYNNRRWRILQDRYL